MNEKLSTEKRAHKHGTEDFRKRSRSRSPQYRIKENDRDKSTEDKVENIGLGPKNRLKSLGVQMKLGSSKPKETKKPKMTVAAVFNADDDSEPEEMPPEAKMRMRNIGRDTPTSSGPNSFGKTKHGFSDAKMRMRNIGRDTPTSSGPNSFGKTKHGFSDAKKVFEKTLKTNIDSVNK